MALACGTAMTLLGRARLGATDEAAVRRAQNELGRRFSDATSALNARVERIEREGDELVRTARDTGATRSLFQLLSTTLGTDSVRAGLTVYGTGAAPLGWAGRVSDIPRDRIDGPRTLYLSLDPLGPRLVRVEPVFDRTRPSAPRLGTIVAEQLVVERADMAASIVDSFKLPTSVVDVSIRATPGAVPVVGPYAFAIRATDGRLLAEADVAPSDLRDARQTWQHRTRAMVLGVLAVALLLYAGPLLEWRRHAGGTRPFAVATASLVLVLSGGRTLLRLAAVPVAGVLARPLELLPDALLLAALVWLALDTLERRRVSRPRARLRGLEGRPEPGVVLRFGLAGAAVAAAVWQYERVLGHVAASVAHDLLGFSFHPFETVRLTTAAALVVLHAAVVWGTAGLLRLPTVFWRTVESRRLHLLAALSATAGALALVLATRPMSPTVPLGPMLVALAASGAAGLALSRPRGGARRASQAARLGLFFVALVGPAVAWYPSLDAYAVASRERMVTAEFAPLVARQREELQSSRLPHTLDTIDASTTLAAFVTNASEDAAPTTDRAFIVWSQTELARTRTTSAIELYGQSGRLVSRFALDLPEYGATEFRGGACGRWEIYEEVSPFGSAQRNVLRASRAICVDRRRVGGIVVRARLDYHSLPFAPAPNPYLQSVMPQTAEPEDGPGADLELAFYGWSRAPLFASGTKVWPLEDRVFEQMMASRQPVWERVVRDGDVFRVYFFNDRGGIYALGYPVVTRFGHLINLAELVFFCGVLYALLLVGASVFNLLSGQTPASGRALLREVRSSFYRKLFLAFVVAAGAPVVVLAVATSTYFSAQFRASVEESAVKTATVAQRLIEDYVALQQRGAGSLDRIDDEFMLLVRRAIDEDVNLFDGPRLRATSERPLFASRLLAGRTPADLYRAIAIDRLPTAVVVEQPANGDGYLVAAAPVRAGAREGIVTVPQTLRQRDIERQIDEIDRRVLSAAVLFILLGSAIGYWMAERIADPVNRLTRATRRIARGDLDARVAATSSDELRRLVDDFNGMADDLQKQRANLERTQRLEAWAEMARQVAHDIKNPLTPIQLSAEHAQRVNLDRGRPLSPALDDCMTAILSQVRILRQISSEFSSFASSPTARPESVDLGALLDEVAEPYRTALASRVTLLVDAQPGLPPVFIDRTLFARALTNVMENALHAMPGGGALTIRASVQDEASAPPSVVVAVTDTGMGMDAEALARIFEPYFSTKATGTGLGLTIARRNVELLGGTIAVQSARGEGTTVTMTLPVVRQR